jgi:hypothetical protein
MLQSNIEMIRPDRHFEFTRDRQGIRWRGHCGCGIAPLSNWHRSAIGRCEDGELTAGGI